MALWAVALVLTLQLFATALHKHGLQEKASDCVACYLVAHSPSGTPSAAVHVPAISALLQYRIIALPLYFFIAVPGYLIPPSHAPPRAVSSL
jgi:hypothetical protein